MRDDDASKRSDLVTLMQAPDLATARLVRGLLESGGIDCIIPDENVLSQASYLTGAAGGLRVQVRAVDRERAQATLDDFRTPDGAAGDEAEDEAAASPEAAAAQRLAQRALRVAILGFILWPLPHPYSLSLAISALSHKELKGPARRPARVALTVSIGSILGFLLVLFSLMTYLR